MLKKKEGKRKENDPVLFFRVGLPETIIYAKMISKLYTDYI